MTILSKYKQPEQYIFAGSDYLYITKKVNKTFVSNKKYYNISLNVPEIKKIPETDINDIRSILLPNDTGVILNSSFFVFNILKFEKIPINRKKLTEIVNWRIEKIFPEDQNLYIHQYYILNSEYILSVLIKKDVKQTIDSFFYKLGLRQTYFGSSTIEISNYLYNTVNPLTKRSNSQKTSDFFIELWDSSATILFQNKFTPFYIRKFNFKDRKELCSEIKKTVDYIKNSYNISSASYSLFQNNTNINKRELYNDLNELKLNNINTENRYTRFIDGVSL